MPKPTFVSRFLSILLLLGLLSGLAGPAQAQPSALAQSARSLISVSIADSTDLASFAASGLPVFAHLQGRGGLYLLTGATPAEVRALAAAGLTPTVLDPDLRGAAYFLAYPVSGRTAPAWGSYGTLLLDDGVQVLLRLSPADADRLSLEGVELAAITFDPKPLPVLGAAASPTAITPDPLIQLMMDQVTQTQVYSYTGDLSGEWPAMIGGAPYTINTRNTNSGEPIQKATQYVGEHMSDLGLDVEYHQWGGVTYPNVIGELPGLTNPDNIYIIGAHLDDMPSSGRAPGADDNASGSVATLVAADILTQYQWGCTLRFAFWTGEEQGLDGSAAYAQRAYNNGENILGYLNLDMIAWNTGGSSPTIDLHARATVPGSLELAQLYADVVDAYGLNLIPSIDPDGTGASDHASFWQYNYAAILAIEDGGDFNPYYHTVNDDMDNFQDWPYYVEFVKASLGTFAHMSGCLIPGGLGAMDGHVTAASGGSPIEGVSLTFDDGAGHVLTAATDASGYYTRTLVAGTYTVTAAAYGYLPETVGGIVIITDTTTTQNFALQTAPTYTISGLVTELGTGLPLYAEVAFDGSPVVVWTDPGTGFYQATLPAGTYTMHARAERHRPAERPIVVSGNQTQDFQLELLPCILLVDDDGNTPDVRSYYTAALDGMGVDYDLHDVATGGDPTYEDLSGYRHVIWFIGEDYGSTLTGDNEAALAAYLDGGGNLFLSAQDYLYDVGVTTFGQNYLHIASFSNDVAQTTVTGANVFNGLGPYTLAYPFTNYSDVVNPDMQAVLAFSGNHGNAAISYAGAAFNTVFLGYPLEAVSLSGRQAILTRALEFFGGCGPADGWVAGHVTDALTGAPVVGADVAADPGGLGSQTDPSGHYSIELAPGLYDVTAQHSCYIAQTAQDISVTESTVTLADFALDPLPPALAVDPPAVEATLVAGTQSAAALSIENVGCSALAYTVTEAAPVDWLSLAPASGIVAPASAISVTVSLDAATLAAGVYTASLDVQSNDPALPLVTVPVTLTVTQPRIVVDPQWVDVTLEIDQQLTTTVTITNMGDADLAYSLTLDVPAAWLSVDPQSGVIMPAALDDVTLAFDSSALLPGVYTTTLAVHSNNPAQPLIAVPVTMTVTAPCEPLSDVSFTWAPITPTVGQVVTFTASATGSLPIAFEWQVPDGYTATGQIVTYTFGGPGVYTVTLTASNGCDQAIIELTVVVTGGKIYLPLVARRP
jgi:hypothetical protein